MDVEGEQLRLLIGGWDCGTKVQDEKRGEISTIAP